MLHLIGLPVDIKGGPPGKSAVVYASLRQIMIGVTIRRWLTAGDASADGLLEVPSIIEGKLHNKHDCVSGSTHSDKCTLTEVPHTFTAGSL